MSKQSAIKRKRKPTIILPIIAAMLVASLFYLGAEKRAEEVIRPMSVPFAAVQLNEHQQIREDHIKFKEVPASSVPPNAILDPALITGKYVSTKNTIPVNNMFMQEHLVEFEDIPSRIGMMLDDDRYGLTMRVDLEKSVANSLRDNMDVQVRFFTRNTPSGQAFEGVLEERIRILAVRDSTGEDVTGPINPSSAEEEEQAQRTRQRVPTVVVFDADDAQASYLLRAQELGELNILAVSETVEESLDPREDEVVSNAEEVKDFVDEETLTKELEKIEEETNADTGHGEKFMGNAVKLFIDAMTHHLESQFEAGDTFVTLSGEIVVYDEELDELRYFDSRERYLGSKYALQGMSEDEIDEHLNRLTGEDN